MQIMIRKLSALNKLELVGERKILSDEEFSYLRSCLLLLKYSQLTVMKEQLRTEYWLEIILKSRGFSLPWGETESRYCGHCLASFTSHGQ